MAGTSTIEWTGVTWNPFRGCSRTSPGCERCYAERQAGRYSGPGLPFEGFVKRTTQGFRWTRKVQLIESALNAPRRWKKPRLVFVNSMSDLLHENVSLEDIQRVFKVMVDRPDHTFQILTKRSDRLAELAPHLPWPKNVWMGVSIESQDYAFRADDLRKVPAAIRFLSVEPMIGPVKVGLTNIDWVICGGESGPGARPMDLDWARDLRDQCIAARVKFFFKQLGGRSGKRSGSEAVLDGRTWTELPSGLMVPKKAK